MAATTYVATTREGNTVVRTSATRNYTHVVLAHKDGQLEGAMGWSGDAANAQKVANTWAGRGFAARVVPVEQALTGKAAKLVLDAVKSAPVEGTTTEVHTVRQGANPIGQLDTEKVAAAIEAVQAERAVAAVVPASEDLPAHVPAKVAKVAKVAPVVEMPVAPDTTELEALLVDIRNNELDHQNMVNARNAMIAKLNEGGLSYAKIAQLTGVTPMATRAMALRANG